MHVRVQLSLPRDASYVPVMRNMASCLLTDLGVPEDPRGDIQIALSEACANVVRHAEGTSDYSVTLTINRDGCEIEVLDAGMAFPAGMLDGQSLPDMDAETGRGMLLMRSLVDDFQFLREDDATRVRLVKRWATLTPRLLSEGPSAN